MSNPLTSPLVSARSTATAVLQASALICVSSQTFGGSACATGIPDGVGLEPATGVGPGESPPLQAPKVIAATNPRTIMKTGRRRFSIWTIISPNVQRRRKVP
jgi:hypothetical protein